MTEKVTIRKAQAGDSGQIATTVAAAFGRHAEADLVENLRAAGEAEIERVALAEGAIAGHILFSRLAATPSTRVIAALAPLSVVPGFQRRGIGSLLIRAGLEECRSRGIDAVVVLGDANYYGRFGFSAPAAKTIDSLYDGPHFQAIALKCGALDEGPWRVAYPAAFAALDG